MNEVISFNQGQILDTKDNKSRLDADPIQRQLLEAVPGAAER